MAMPWPPTARVGASGAATGLAAAADGAAAASVGVVGGTAAALDGTLGAPTGSARAAEAWARRAAMTTASAERLGEFGLECISRRLARFRETAPRDGGPTPPGP